MSSWVLVWFVTPEPRQELLNRIPWGGRSWGDMLQNPQLLSLKKNPHVGMERKEANLGSPNAWTPSGSLGTLVSSAPLEEHRNNRVLGWNPTRRWPGEPGGTSQGVLGPAPSQSSYILGSRACPWSLWANWLANGGIMTKLS